MANKARGIEEISISNCTLETTLSDYDRTPFQCRVLKNCTHSTDGTLKVRKGYKAFSSYEYPSIIRTHTSFNGSIIVFCDDGVYRTYESVVGSGVYITAKIHTITNGKCSFIETKGLLTVCNGTDAPFQINNTFAVSVIPFTSSDPTIYPITPSKFIGVMVYNDTIYFWTKDTKVVWFLGIGATQGIAYPDDYSAEGVTGNIVAVFRTPFNHAGKYSTDDNFVVAFEGGQLLMYNGTNPSPSFDDWRRVQMIEGTPIAGQYAVCPVVGDTFVITKGRVKGMQNILTEPADEQAQREAITGILERGASFGTFGYQIIKYSKDNLIIINIPTSDNTSVQIVQTQVINKETTWEGLNAKFWSVFKENLLFSKDTKILYVMDGHNDAGTKITMEVKTGYTYLNENYKNSEKQVCELQPTLYSKGNVAITGKISSDFKGNKFTSFSYISKRTVVTYATMTYSTPLRYPDERREPLIKTPIHGQKFQIELNISLDEATTPNLNEEIGIEKIQLSYSI